MGVGDNLLVGQQGKEIIGCRQAGKRLPGILFWPPRALGPGRVHDQMVGEAVNARCKPAEVITAAVIAGVATIGEVTQALSIAERRQVEAVVVLAARVQACQIGFRLLVAGEKIGDQLATRGRRGLLLSAFTLVVRAAASCRVMPSQVPPASRSRPARISRASVQNAAAAEGRE